MKRISTMIPLLFLIYSVSAQEGDSDLAVGKLCPDFNFSDVQYYRKCQLSRDDFKGQWLVIDCWNRYCSVCLKKMVKVDSLQNLFRQVNFLLVGYTGSQYTKKQDDRAIRSLFERIRPELNIHLPVAYDSVLFHRFNITACPFMIIIDPNGIVRGITNSLTEEDICLFLEGKIPILSKAHRKEKSLQD